MKARYVMRSVLPALALGSAFLLLKPANPVSGFVTNGDSLGLGQRDWRLFNNFADAEANANATPSPMFPGALGAEQAMWKGIAEWGSRAHGNGTGDPSQPAIGNGGANFDSSYCGNATAIGNTNHNVVSAISSCTNGVLAFAEPPYDDGWRIRFCDGQWVWDDGPGSVGFRQDMQGVMTHEYGHALGLGHSQFNRATMYFASVTGSLDPRSIFSDDVEGIQFIYGVADPDKPIICETIVAGGNITIKGVKLDLIDNDVWFTRSAATAASIADPRLRVLGVPSTNNGTEITIPIPAGAGSGDVLVKTSATGAKSLSNAFPYDVNGGTITAETCPFAVATISPAIMDPLVPGTAQTVTVTGNRLDTVVSIDLNGNSVPGGSWTSVNASTITIDMPLGLLGANTLTLSDGDDSFGIPFTVQEPASPILELGTGDPANVIPNGSMMNIVVAGKVGTTHQIFYSPSNVPSMHPAVTFDIGNMFTQLQFGAVFTVGPNAYKQFSAPVTFIGGAPKVFYSQSVDVTTPPAPQFATSNVQSVTLTP